MIRTIYDKTDPQKAEAFFSDLLGEIVLKVVDEPTYDNVAHLCSPMSETRAIIGLKEYPFAIGVDWDGTLNRAGYGYYDNRKDRDPLDIIYFKVGNPPKMFRELGWENTSRLLLDGHLPAITTWGVYDGIEYSQTVFAHSENMSRNKDMEVYIEFKAKNILNKPKNARVEICADPGRTEISCKVYQCQVKAYETTKTWFKIEYHNSQEARLEKDISKRGNIKIEILSVKEDEYKFSLMEVRKFWERLLAEGTKISTSEERVNNGFKAWRIYNFLNTRKIRKDNKIICVPHDGSGFYAVVYGRSAASDVHALLLTGHFKEARLYLQGLLSYQQEDGLFLERDGLSGNGALLFVLSEYYILSNDRKGFLEFLPAIKRLSEWVIKNRIKEPSAKGKLTYGLLPPKRYSCDIKIEDYCYYSDVYNWKGLNDLSIVLSKAGMDEEANYLKEEANSYREDIYFSMGKASFPEKELFKQGKDYKEDSYAWQNRGVYQSGSLVIVPMTPISRYLERTFGGGHYYAIFAGHVLETGFFEVEDSLYKKIVEFVEKRGGFLLGLLRWFDYTGIDHAYTYGYLLNKMREDSTEKVLLGFYSMLAYGMSRDTFSAGECVNLSGKGVYGEGKYGEGVYAAGAHHHCQPHSYSNTQQIRLLRMMLVREEKDDLLLAFSIPRKWLEDGQELSIKDAPTRWGKLSYCIRSKSNQNEIEAYIELSLIREEYPASIQLRLRHPQKKQIKEVEIENEQRKAYNINFETVILPYRSGRTNIVIRYDN